MFPSIVNAWGMGNSKINKNWDDLRLFLPKGWTSKAKELGVFSRKRQFSSVGALLRVLLIHLLEGCSLRETAERAKQGGICDVSGVALHKRLRKSGDWFNWMALRLMERKGVKVDPPSWLEGYRVKTADASVICEPGSTGTDWRLHYSMELFGLKADQFKLTDPSVGETFKNFEIRPGELWLADRAYCHHAQLIYITGKGADFLVRWKAKGASLFRAGEPFDLLQAVGKLSSGDIGDWPLTAGTTYKKQTELALRICAIPKSREKARGAIRAYKKQAVKKGKSYSAATLELQKYIIVATSLPDSIGARKIMELYRARWQEEIAFKRMKSLINIGQLPKKDPQSCLAWLQGKIFVCALVQAVLDEARFFPPWGYPLTKK